MASSSLLQEESPKRERHPVLLPFAAVALNLLALFNGLDAMAALTDSHVLTGTDRYVFGDLHSAGWALLFLAALQGLAGVGLLTGGSWARWVAIVALCLNVFTQFAFMAAYPAWSLAILAVDVVALYAVVTSQWPPPPARLPQDARTDGERG